MNEASEVIKKQGEKYAWSLNWFSEYVNSEGWLDDKALYTENEARRQLAWYDGAHTACIQIMNDTILILNS